MQLRYIGIGLQGNNPDGSFFFPNSRVFISPTGVMVDANWLIRFRFVAIVGDVPEIPPHLEHWFVKKTDLNKPIKSEEERLKAMAEVDALMKIPEGDISEELGNRLEVLAILIQDYEKRTVKFGSLKQVWLVTESLLDDSTTLYAIATTQEQADAFLREANQNGRNTYESNCFELDEVLNFVL